MLIYSSPAFVSHFYLELQEHFQITLLLMQVEQVYELIAYVWWANENALNLISIVLNKLFHPFFTLTSTCEIIRSNCSVVHSFNCWLLCVNLHLCLASYANLCIFIGIFYPKQVYGLMNKGSHRLGFLLVVWTKRLAKLLQLVMWFVDDRFKVEIKTGT